MCDKPLTNEAAEADALVLLVEQTGVQFTVGYVMSCFPMVRQAREIVASGQLGEINQIHVEFMQDWMTPPDSDKAEHVKWRLDPKASGPTSCTGDIGTHAAHLAGFVTGHKLTDLRAEFHVCGAPKLLEDTVFMSTRYDGRIPGTLMATRLAPGNRGGLRLRVFGSAGGLEWDLESCDQLKLNIFGRPDQTLSRGHGHGLSAATERLVRSGRGFPEGIIEAWANLYTEFAVAIAAQKDGVQLPYGYMNCPMVSDGAEGVRFIEAAVGISPARLCLGDCLTRLASQFSPVQPVQPATGLITEQKNRAVRGNFNIPDAPDLSVQNHLFLNRRIASQFHMIQTPEF